MRMFQRPSVVLSKKTTRATVCYSNKPIKKMITPEQIDKAIKEAMEEQDQTASASQWDIVHELVVHYQHQERKKKQEDPLEKYCQTDESSFECREYDL